MPINARQDTSNASDDDGLLPPSKRVKMLSKACEACKLKKSRCDSSRPQCETCRRKGTTCIYRERGQPGLRPGYGKAMESRLEILESNVEKINRSLQEVLNQLRVSGGAPDFAASSAALQRTEPEPLVANSISDVQLWQEPPQDASQVPAFTETPVLETLSPASQDMTRLNDHGSRLPPDDIMQQLVDIYFDLVYPWVPLFYRPGFMANLYSPDRRILLHGIVVIAFRFWKNATPSAEVRETYTQNSRDHILLKAIDTCSLVSAQAFTLLALDAIGQDLGPRTWNIMAMLNAVAQQLCLAKDSSLPTNDASTPLVNNEDPSDDLDLSIIETEEKRRLFWTIYSLDRFSSVSQGQSGGINTKIIKLPYPANDDSWGQSVAPEWFQPSESVKTKHVHYPVNLWHHNIDLLALVDRSNRLLIQPVNLSLSAHCQEWQSNFRRLDINLSTWFENLPPEVRETRSTFDPMWTMIHATFYLINIRMYTVAAFPSTTSPYLRASSSARGRCRQAIRDVASLLSPLQAHELDQLGPMFAFVVWVAARSLIILWTTGYENTYGSMPTDLEPLLSCLRHLSMRWPCAQRYADIIQLILDTKNNPGGAAGLEIFNDTRRTAYGLQNRLGNMAVHRPMEIYSNSFDFLDLRMLDVGEIGASRTGIGSHGPEIEIEWL